MLILFVVITMRPEDNDRHFADNIFRYIFVRFLIQITLFLLVLLLTNSVQYWYKQWIEALSG